MGSFFWIICKELQPAWSKPRWTNSNQCHLRCSMLCWRCVNTKGYALPNLPGGHPKTSSHWKRMQDHIRDDASRPWAVGTASLQAAWPQPPWVHSELASETAFAIAYLTCMRVSALSTHDCSSVQRPSCRLLLQTRHIHRPVPASGLPGSHDVPSRAVPFRCLAFD